jgi:hypothetical protein
VVWVVRAVVSTIVGPVAADLFPVENVKSHVAVRAVGRSRNRSAAGPRRGWWTMARFLLREEPVPGTVAGFLPVAEAGGFGRNVASVP